MRDWVRSWFSKAADSPKAERPRYHDPRWDLVPTEAEVGYVADCLQTFAATGLILNEPSNRAVAVKVATEVLHSLVGTAEITPVVSSLNRIVQIRGGEAPLNVLWHQDDEESAPIFANAKVFEDHCYDGAYPADWANLIAGVCKLAGDTWQFDRGDDAEVHEAGVDVSDTYIVSFRSVPVIAPFSIMPAKDVDWSLIDRLNERIPADCKRRFGWIGDVGSALVVFLEPDQIRRVSEFCGHEIFMMPGTEN